MSSLPIVTREQMRELDRQAIEECGIPGLILMENAGLRTAEAVDEFLRGKSGAIIVACGKGNNGGDGFVVARHLANRGHKVRVFLFASEKNIRGDAATNLAIWKSMGETLTEILDDAGIGVFRRELTSAAVVIDALFGTGLDKEVTGIFRLAIDAINSAQKPVVAVDIPSGLCANTGRVMGAAVRAVMTVTFGLAKRGLSLEEGPSYCGDVKITDISLPRKLVDKLNQ